MQKCCKCFKSTPENIAATSHALFWNWTLRFIMEAYLELSFGSLIKFFSNELSFSHSKTDSIDTFFAYLWLGILPLVPVILIVVLTLKEKVIR
jgi:hypothetical protein